MNITGIRIPVDLDEPLERREIEMGDIKDYQLIVGGMFDVIDFEQPPASVFFNDEGKIIGLPMNRRATTLLWACSIDWIAHDYLMGDVLLLGQPDDEGDTQSVPDELLSILLNPGMFRIEVQTGTDDWSGNELRFDDVWNAYAWGVALASRWSQVTALSVKRA